MVRVGDRGAECGAGGAALLVVGLPLVVWRCCGVRLSALESGAFGGGCGEAGEGVAAVGWWWVHDPPSELWVDGLARPGVRGSSGTRPGKG